MKKSAILFLLLLISGRILAQGTFSGDLMMNLNSFQRDTNIKASGNPLYDNYLSGSEGWLDLRYNIKGFTFFVRADKLIKEAGLTASTSEAGRKIKEGAVQINGKVLQQPVIVLSVKRSLTIRVGRKVAEVVLTLP